MLKAKDWDIFQAHVESESHSVMSDSLRPHGLDSPWNSPGQNTGVVSLSLLQGIFPTQGSNSGLPHCKQILYQLSHQGSPRILEWVGYPFSRGSSWPRNRTGVSCIAGGFFPSWAIREASLFNQPITFGDSFQFWLFFSFQFILFYRVLLITIFCFSLAHHFHCLVVNRHKCLSNHEFFMSNHEKL